MHIVDGILSAPVIAAGTLAAAGGVAVGLRRMGPEQVPRAALLAAVFFVASLIHVPLGPVSAHLTLAGLMGLLMGWLAFPAVLVGLLLQGMFFGFGGVTVLGVNTLNLALPAVLLGLALGGPGLAGASPRAAALRAFVAGAGAVAGSALLVAGSLALSGEALVLAARLTVAAHVPVMLVEGIVTAVAVLALRRLHPAGLAPFAYAAGGGR